MAQEGSWLSRAEEEILNLFGRHAPILRLLLTESRQNAHDQRERDKVINKKLDQLLAGSASVGDLKPITEGLKKSGDALTDAVAKNQPKL